MAFKVDKCDSPAMPWDGREKEFLLKKRIDFRLSANQLAQNEIMGIFEIPGNVLVEEVLLNVITADADVSDVDVGSFSTAGVAVAADGFIDGADVSTGGVKRDIADETYSLTNGTGGYVASANWKIGLTNKDAQALDAAVIDVIARCIDLR